MYYKLTVILLLCIVNRGFAQQVILNKALAVRIDSLKNEDQKPALNPDAKQAELAFKKVIRSNFPMVKKILDKYGFPGYDLVGKESAANYWLLVQHSDFDLPFQKRALRLMEAQVKKGNASGSNYAYLIDRISINEGRKQVYGTQIQMTSNGYQPKPLLDSLNVDQRRRIVGLSSLADYLVKANTAFNEMNKGRAQVPIETSMKDSVKH